ncbi:DUF192 domain-containing protein [Ureibacillus sp. NPDC094379]
MRKTIVRILSGMKETLLTVYVANTQEKREKGLMFVKKLPEDQGMLFVFPEKVYDGFWMKNTFIPLSIAFIDSDGKILKILNMWPCLDDECPTYHPQVFYQYAIEVNDGWFERNQVREGDYVKFD